MLLRLVVKANVWYSFVSVWKYDRGWATELSNGTGQCCGFGSAWICIILGSRIRIEVKKDPHQSEKVEALEGSFWSIGGSKSEKSE